MPGNRLARRILDWGKEKTRGKAKPNERLMDRTQRNVTNH
jgi:hypothetical protein